MSNSKWAPEDKGPKKVKTVVQSFPVSKPVIVKQTLEITPMEALQSARMFFDRFTGFSLIPPMPGESAQQYSSRMGARLGPIMTAAQSVKEVVKKGLANGSSS